jgi:endonuclease/exonuclease/phosphatase family metal-dependent hydrolase
VCSQGILVTRTVMSAPFRIMTYNIHSCRGRDGVFSPKRIAEVIVQYAPDAVCLQELDVRLMRSNTVDQAAVIADSMEMDFHFHPSFRIEKGYFGNAVLSRYPMRLVKAGELPTFPHRRLLEKRGAIWVELRTGERTVNLINTHLGLKRRERQTQIDLLLGPEWLGGTRCDPPVILCGDLNASPLSGVYRKVVNRLIDVQKRMKGHRPKSTWPSAFPFIRIDHIFVSDTISVRDIQVPVNGRMREASDHLPVIAEIDLT